MEGNNTAGDSSETKDPAPKPETENRDTDFVSKAEHEKLKKAHDQAAFDYRKLLDEVKELRSKTKTGTPDEGGSKSKLELAEKTINELQSKLKGAETELFDLRVTSQVRNVAAKFVSEDALDDFMALSRGKFEFVADEKGERIVHREHPWSSLEEVIDQKVPTYMRKSTRVNGTGASSGPNTTATNGSKVPNVAQLEKLGSAERRAMLAKHPELRKAWSEKGMAG